MLDTEAILFAVGGVLNQIKGDRDVVTAYASLSLRQSQRRYCTTRLEMLAAVMMCTHFRVLIFGVLNSLCARITVPSGGFKSFAIMTVF